jgi:hypothetical protein
MLAFDHIYEDARGLLPELGFLMAAIRLGVPDSLFQRAMGS